MPGGRVYTLLRQLPVAAMMHGCPRSFPDVLNGLRTRRITRDGIQKGIESDPGDECGLSKHSRPSRRRAFEAR
jgi:hypothetical protein